MEVLYGVPEKEAAAGGGRTKSGLRTGKILASFLLCVTVSVNDVATDAQQLGHHHPILTITGKLPTHGIYMFLRSNNSLYKVFLC